MNIYFSGLIGVGKTTVGKALAGLLGWEFDDLDNAMERSAGKNFRQVVQDEGWLGFRMREYSIIKQFVQMDHMVFGLGGGTVRYEWNRDVLKGTGVNIMLITDISVLTERLRDNDRPRVNPGMTMEEDLAWMWNKHKDVYLGFADIVFRTDQGKTIEQEALELFQILNQKYSAL